MTERLADISDRITGIRQLGAVVNAMRGIAAARAQQARGQLVAVDSYSATIAAAISQALALIPPPTRSGPERGEPRSALVLFCAEQGFAGAFSERVLDAAAPDLLTSGLFVIGARGHAAMADRGIAAGWTGAMPSHPTGIPKLADHILQALYHRLAAGKIDRLEIVFTSWQPGHATHVDRKQLFPLDLAALSSPAGANPPLLNLTPATLLLGLTADYMHAQLCEAALHAFAAENEARMETMAAAHNQIERQLTALQATSGSSGRKRSRPK